MIPLQRMAFALVVLFINARSARANYRSTPLCAQYGEFKDNKHKIVELQCIAKCDVNHTLQYADMLACRKACEIDAMRSPRPGQCPTAQHFLQRYSCVDGCSLDFDCPEVQKCCPSACSPMRSICMDTLGLDEDDTLPSIPKILRYRLPRGNKVELTIESSANLTYFYYVEARHHIGLRFSPRKLGVWEWQPVVKIAEATSTRSKWIDVSFKLKAGRWYQVRVAAVNGNGFRGYSEPSQPFALKSFPKPPKPPADLKVVKSHFDGALYAIRIAWCPSKSNLPIEKYKIIWSLYVKTKDESIISNETYVKDRHQFDIDKLLPDSSYYIQVQAISISGSRRLKSEKLSILYNTTMKATPYSLLRCTQQVCRPKSEDISYKVHNITNSNIADSNMTNVVAYKAYFRYNRKFGIIVQITGFQTHREKVYQICPKNLNCLQSEYTAIRAKKDMLEFNNLKYNTTYELRTLSTNTDTPSETEEVFIFTTPKCENFRKRFPKIQIKC